MALRSVQVVMSSALETVCHHELAMSIPFEKLTSKIIEFRLSNKLRKERRYIWVGCWKKSGSRCKQV